MRRIYKYPLPLRLLAAGYTYIDVMMAEGAEVIHVHDQFGDPCLLALVASDKQTTRRFQIFGTGHPIEGDGLKYMGTAHCGMLVWHVFEAL
jgi:hypothetical protein